MEEIVKRGRGRPRKYSIEERPPQPKKPKAIVESEPPRKAAVAAPAATVEPKAKPIVTEQPPMPAFVRGRGRPEYIPSEADCKVVEEMKAFGENNNMIARALEISEPTLIKYYDDQLQNGVARKRREAITLQWEAARTGKQSAINKVLEHTGITAADDKLKNLPDDKPIVKQAKLGKKEIAMEAAKTAGIDSSWGSDLMPVMAVRN